jgi:hypothetical protein
MTFKSGLRPSRPTWSKNPLRPPPTLAPAFQHLSVDPSYSCIDLPTIPSSFLESSSFHPRNLPRLIPCPRHCQMTLKYPLPVS